jgi:hypothetical protein
VPAVLRFLPALQAASAAALSLLAARDPVVSDTLRYLGALPLLVELLNSPNLTVTEAARYDASTCNLCLLCFQST